MENIIKYGNCLLDDSQQMAEILLDMMMPDPDGYDCEEDLKLVKDLTAVLDKVKDYGYYNPDFEMLYEILDGALFGEQSLTKDWRKLRKELDDLEKKGAES